MSTINIPADAAKAVAELGTLGALLQAREWQRAAIVYALVGPAPGSGPRSQNDKSVVLTITDLVAEEVVGLRSHVSIRFYRDAWQSAINEGAAGPVVLGDTITIPDDWDWPPAPTGLDRSNEGTSSRERADAIREQAARDGSGPSKAVDIASNPKALRTAIKADPATAQAARQALEEAAQERHDQTIRDAGGNPAGVQAFEGDDITDWNHEVVGIRVRMGNLRADIERARRSAEQRGIPAERLGEMLSESLGALTASIYGGVPDTIEGLTS